MEIGVLEEKHTTRGDGYDGPSHALSLLPITSQVAAVELTSWIGFELVISKFFHTY